MLVSSAASLSSPAGAFRLGVLFRDDAMLSAGDTRPVITGVAVAALLTPGLPPSPSPGRMVGTLRVWLEPRPGPKDAIVVHVRVSVLYARAEYQLLCDIPTEA